MMIPPEDKAKCITCGEIFLQPHLHQFQCLPCYTDQRMETPIYADDDQGDDDQGDDDQVDDDQGDDLQPCHT